MVTKLASNGDIWHAVCKNGISAPLSQVTNPKIKKRIPTITIGTKLDRLALEDSIEEVLFIDF
jgi:hypothetical protein